MLYFHDGFSYFEFINKETSIENIIQVQNALRSKVQSIHQIILVFIHDKFRKRQKRRGKNYAMGHWGYVFKK